MSIWIDLTDLEIWSGHMTGTQRVAYNIACRYADSRQRMRFFVFREVTGKFYEVDFAPIRSRIEAAQVVSGAGIEVVPAVTLRQRLKRLPKAVVHRMPASVKQRIPAAAKTGLRKAYRGSVFVAKSAYGRLGRQAVSAVESLPAAHFNSDDTLLILGKPWDFPSFMHALGVLKDDHKFKLVTLVHDLIPTLEPHLFGPGLFEPFTKTMFEVCALSDGLLAVSKSTQKDIGRFCDMINIKQPKVTVVREGDEIIASAAGDTATPDPRVEAGKFLLCVGTIEVRKNIALVYMAYREAYVRGIELPLLVVVGRPGWLTGDALYQMTHDEAVKDKFIILHGLTDQQLRWLYLNCRYSIFPSAYEGWGLPVAESVGYGKLCITSTISSMPEIAGDLLEYHSPYNSQALLDLMVKYLDDDTLRKKERQIAKEYKPTSWDKTYNQTSEFVKSVSR